MSNHWDKHDIKWKGKTYTITGAQLATIQTMYAAMLEADGEPGSHSHLRLAFYDAGIRGLEIGECKHICRTQL